MIRTLSLSVIILALAACSQAPAPITTPSPTAQSRVAGPGEYVVKRGDTLYRIARENGLDHVELATLNNIDNPSSLREGQILRLRPVASATPASVATVASPIGVGSAVESRPLDTATPKPVVSGRPVLGEPRGGKEPYSDEAYARLNNVQAAAPSVAVAPTPAPPAPSAAAAPAEVEGVLWAWPSAAGVKAGYNGSSNKGIDFGGKAGDPVLAAGDGKVLYVGDALAGYGRLAIIKHSTDILSVYAHNRRILVKEGQAVKRGQKIAEMGDTGTDSVKLHFEIRKQGKPVDPMPFLPKK